MALLSSRRSISYPNPDRSDRPDIPLYFLNVINALELDVVFVQGTDAARIAAAHIAGKIWYSTDTLNFWWDTGAVWVAITPGTTFGTYASRPAANAVPAGSRYLATDTLGLFYSDGTAWTLLAQGTPRISAAAFALAPWTTPYDNMKVALTVDATAGVYWTFQYNSGSASSYKWEFVGGPGLYAEILTSEGLTTATYSALTTAGPAITLPRAGDYEVSIGAWLQNNTPNSTNARMSYDIGGTTAVDADKVEGTGGSQVTSTGSRTRLKTGLTAVTLTAKYRSDGVNNGQFANRWMRVGPIRIS